MTLDGSFDAGAYELPRLRRRAGATGAEAAADAFADFYRAEFPRLAGYCKALVGAESQARDIAQESLVRVYSRWVDVSSPRAYAYLTATNLARRTWRRRAVERDAHSKMAAATRTAPDPADSDRAWLRELVEGLPSRLRPVVLLHYYADLPVEEVGRLLRLPVGTVKSRLHEARAALAVRVRDPGR